MSHRSSPAPRRRNASLVAISVFLFGVVVATGQAPPPTPHTTLTAGITEAHLPNGLRVLTKEVHSAPVVSLSVWYQVGSRQRAALFRPSEGSR